MSAVAVLRRVQPEGTVQVREQTGARRRLQRVQTEQARIAGSQLAGTRRAQRLMRDLVGASDAGGQVCVMER